MSDIKKMTLAEKVSYLRDKHPVKIPVNVAAKMIDSTEAYIRAGIIQGKLCFGSGVQGEKGRWIFNIPTERFITYLSGADIVTNTKDNLLENLKEAFDKWYTDKRIAANQPA